MLAILAPRIVLSSFCPPILYSHLQNRLRPFSPWHPSLTYKRLKAFEAGVVRAGGSPRIWGFVDGTFRGFCRPSGGFEEQLAAYSGHKKAYGMVWQAVVTPTAWYHRWQVYILDLPTITVCTAVLGLLTGFVRLWAPMRYCTSIGTQPTGWSLGL
jgi:hypothetical protein